MNQNKIKSPTQLLSKLTNKNQSYEANQEVKIENESFVKFIQSKVLKIGNISGLISAIDIDKDGFINEADLSTALKNVESDQFLQNLVSN